MFDFPTKSRRMPALSSEDRWGSPITAALANSGRADGCPSRGTAAEPRRRQKTCSRCSAPRSDSAGLLGRAIEILAGKGDHGAAKRAIRMARNA